MQCVTANGCDKVCPDELAACGLTNCAVELTSLPETCYGCIQANIGNDIDDIITTCQAPTTSYAYGGSFGIGLLAATRWPWTPRCSRAPPIAAASLTPCSTRRSARCAPCTHLTAVFKDITYPKPTGSGKRNKLLRINQLIQW
jgi:hypothetical protein